MKMRGRIMIGLAAALLLLSVVVLPRISEAGRFKWFSSEQDPAEKSASADRSLTSEPVQGQKFDITVVASYHNDTSIPLRDMKPHPVVLKTEREANPRRKLPNNHKDSPDPVVQSRFHELTTLFTPNMPTPILNFNGIGFPGVACNCAPPDTNGEVGATQYVQIVNAGFQVFNKTTGASVLGPVGISTIWAGFNGPCETAGAGDPVVLYDQLANRWVISQFAGTSIPTDECVAVSTTSDATGSYNRYGFHLGSNFFDYPHLGVWPDAYYMSMNVFNSTGTAFLGPQPFAFDRTRMLAGQPATFITTGITGGSSEETYLPADLDGSNLPPPDAPASFVEFPAGGSFRIFHFHVDFVTPNNSTFTLFASAPSAGFTIRSGGVPQFGTASLLDPIGDRLMFRLATRFFADGHEATVGNFTVSSGGVAAPRWFELRNVTSGPVTVTQQGTYQPDTTHRWMGATAMDQQGNIALGYSASSSAINPQIRYAGRLASDPVNTLPQTEVTLFAGTGSQTGTNGRWGDYSDMTIDPVDDCTFWYTQEYYATTTSFAWRTRIGSFKFPGCGGSPTPTPTPTPTPGVAQEAVWTALISARSLAGGGVEHSGPGYYAMAQTSQTISGPGYFEWTFDGDLCVVGLGNQNDEQVSGGFTDLDFAFSFGTSSSFEVYERGAWRQGGAAAAGDVFRIEVAGSGDVVYLRNGAVIHVTTNPVKAYPYYLVFKAQGEVGRSISAGRVLVSGASPTPTP
ncbi:MAG: hypothetical protein ACR2LM_19190, partial [Pyrinomonadaceae bacterium]